jgi:hypothetical protein
MGGYIGEQTPGEIEIGIDFGLKIGSYPAQGVNGPALQGFAKALAFQGFEPNKGTDDHTEDENSGKYWLVGIVGAVHPLLLSLSHGVGWLWHYMIEKTQFILLSYNE